MHSQSHKRRPGFAASPSVPFASSGSPPIRHPRNLDSGPRASHRAPRRIAVSRAGPSPPRTRAGRSLASYVKSHAPSVRSVGRIIAAPSSTCDHHAMAAGGRPDTPDRIAPIRPRRATLLRLFPGRRRFSSLTHTRPARPRTPSTTKRRRPWLSPQGRQPQQCRTVDAMLCPPYCRSEVTNGEWWRSSYLIYCHAPRRQPTSEGIASVYALAHDVCAAAFHRPRSANCRLASAVSARRIAAGCAQRRFLTRSSLKSVEQVSHRHRRATAITVLAIIAGFRSCGQWCPCTGHDNVDRRR